MKPRAAGEGYEFREVWSREELQDLRGEWEELWRRTPSATPFQSPSWLLPWCRTYGQEMIPWVVLARAGDDGRLSGLAPLATYREPSTGERKVMLLGSGNTDHLDLLAEAGCTLPLAEAVVHALADRPASWDSLDFQQLPRESALIRVSCPDDWQEELSVQSVCPVAELPDSPEKLAEIINPRQWQNYRRCLRHALSGEVSGRIEAATGETFDRFFSELIRLHTARWNGQSSGGVLCEERDQNFHREAALHFLHQGTLRLYALLLDEQIIAVYYGLCRGDCAYYYIGGFSPEHASLSPGALLVGHAMEEAVREGAQAFDFLRGAEKYKYLWGAKDVAAYSRKLWPAGSPARRVLTSELSLP